MKKDLCLDWIMILKCRTTGERSAVVVSSDTFDGAYRFYKRAYYKNYHLLAIKSV